MATVGNCSGSFGPIYAPFFRSWKARREALKHRMGDYSKNAVKEEGLRKELRCFLFAPCSRCQPLHNPQMPNDAPIEKLLHGAFKEEERQYLAQHPAFQYQRKNTPNTTEGFERLVEVGSLLLRQREDLALLLKRHKDEAN